MRGPGGSRFELCFAAAAQDGRSRVSLDARLVDGTNAAAARAVVEVLRRALGGAGEPPR
jgi:hypothetical protein